VRQAEVHSTSTTIDYKSFIPQVAPHRRNFTFKIRTTGRFEKSEVANMRQAMGHKMFARPTLIKSALGCG